MDLADKMAMIARHGGLTKGDHRIEGINSRLDGLQAAILEVKLKYLAKSGIENFVDLDTADQAAGNVISTFVDTLRDRIDKVKQVDEVYDDLYKTEKRKRKTKLADSDLTEFME